ncbi:MAG: PEP/pyruvate-binding domain-containing protein [Proteiniphilum sp.]|nr:PEP/pyruvate-binding domain-containing protein [Proteiniphilum sp.]MDD3076037.1 PEP/pyruvate-binding domain-containing protein [Proteiniphilum sp.]MDD3954743.1 PEP/pyruvate-binding domain-containing protein [Proteiniphilum sp.]MDD4451242.1 PEP/pyruvate-binding domain-containing protein [Proteiniphilum sp.]
MKLKTSRSVISAHDISQFRFRDTPFVKLMNKRIYNILMVASRYDMFILEDDGRVDEQIFNEYTSLNLRYPPRFTLVSSNKEALSELKQNHYELIICMPNMDSSDTFDLAKQIKARYAGIPVVLLTPFSKSVTLSLSREDLSGIDYVFSWLGDTDLLLAIIKVVEDRMNVEHDVMTVGVQTIMLVEDSVRFYSSALPLLYKFVLSESREFSKEALNDHLRMLRMRGRPKILLARNYEEAVSYYRKYGDNMLGVISDMSFNVKGEKDKQAGKRLGEWIREKDTYIPIIYTSSESENRKYIQGENAFFIDKNSKTFPQDLRKAIKDNLGFGDFIITDPKTKEEIFRIKNLKELQMNIRNIPDDALYEHLSRNHFSRFFYSRAMFPVAEMLKKIDVSEYATMNDARELIYATIVQYRKMKNTGVVAVFEKDRFDQYSNFARIGEGSLGGKGRGLAFIGYMVKTHLELNNNPNFPVTTPKTVVLCTDIFDEFMEANDLYPVALSEQSDEDILRHFLAARLPKRMVSDFLVFFEAIEGPVAIRSSSLLEDSQYQPFAGIYATYMIPYVNDKYEMVRLLSNAIKAVYASAFYKDSKAYMLATQNLIDQEKMAIVLQEVVGSQYGNLYYPAISGVARSINYYPISDEKTEDGIVNLAFGLGKYIMDGRTGLRFSPLHASRILQLSSLELALRDTQTQFYALDLDSVAKDFTIDDGFNLLKLRLREAEQEGPLRYVASTYDPQDQIIRDGFYEGGRKIVSFANILQHDMFPLAEVLDKLLKAGQKEMGRPVEIEFAVDIKDPQFASFYVLQIRPIVDSKEVVHENLEEIALNKTVLFSRNALGNGISNDVFDVVYVKSAAFNAAMNPVIAREIENLNKEFLVAGNNYVLVGPGRWGSSDPWLGIPVKWPHISQARLIVESGMENYRIEPSQGTHFFQNLTSFGVGYFTVNPFLENDGFFDEAFLNAQPARYETDYIRQVHFNQPLCIKINGKKRMGVVLKP